MNNTVENDFLFPRVQWLHLTGKVDNLKIFVSNFLRISHAKKTLTLPKHHVVTEYIRAEYIRGALSH